MSEQEPKAKKTKIQDKIKAEVKAEVKVEVKKEHKVKVETEDEVDGETELQSQHDNEDNGREEEEAEDGEDEEEKDDKKRRSDMMKSKKSEDGGSYFELSNYRRLAVRKFKGSVLIDIREFYEKNGKSLPGKKGISLSLEQYNLMRDLVKGGQIDKEIAKLK